MPFYNIYYSTSEIIVLLYREQLDGVKYILASFSSIGLGSSVTLQWVISFWGITYLSKIYFEITLLRGIGKYCSEGPKYSTKFNKGVT